MTTKLWAERWARWHTAAIVIGAVLFFGSPSFADDPLPADITELRSVAEKGDPVAQFCLGNRYYAAGRKDPAKDVEAEKWFRLSAAQGNALAEEHLGQLYYAGRGESQDYAKAATWFRMAAEQGHRTAQRQLAQMYREGKGVPVDRDEAKKWNDLAAHAAPPTPCYDVSNNFFTAPNGASLPAFPDLRRKAEKGDAEAQFELGKRYYDERVRDPAKDSEAQKWLRLAAAQGSGQAEDRLGWIYYRGNGVPQDYTEAANWYRQGAEHGNLDAMTRLGNMHCKGEGVPRDRDKCRELINKANEIGTRPARIREYKWLVGLLLGVVAFASSLTLLQRNKVSGWRRVGLASFVHIIGIALVLNSLIAFGLPELLFPKCSYGFLAASCDYQDAGVRSFATTLRNWQMFNLIWTFMGMIGLIFHALALWYVVYLGQRLFPRRALRDPLDRMPG